MFQLTLPNRYDRVCATLNVTNGVQPSAKQLGELQARYHVFRLQVSQSIAGTLSIRVRLSDGSAAHFASFMGRDVINFEPSATGSADTSVPHGFMVSSSWTYPCIYGFDSALAPPWGVKTKNVPQDPHNIESYNSVARLTPDEVTLPLVFVKSKKRLWDYLVHAGYDTPTSDPAVPVNLEYVVDGNTVFKPHGAHYAIGNKINDYHGTTLYTMAPSSPIASESPINLAGNTSTTGANAVLQAYRKFQIAPGVTRYRFWNEALTRTSPAGYSAVRNEVTVDTPIAATTVSSSDVTSATLGVAFPANSVFFINWHMADSDSAHRSFFGTTRTYLDNSNSLTPVSENAFRREITRVAGAPVTVSAPIALPAASAIQYAQLQAHMDYPQTQLWRGGNKRINGTWDTSNAIAVGSTSFIMQRADVLVDMNAAPKATLALNWIDLDIIKGTVTCHVEGFKHDDQRLGFTLSGPDSGYDYYVAEPISAMYAAAGDGPGGPNEFAPADTRFALEMAAVAGFNNMKPQMVGDWAQYDMPGWHTLSSASPIYNTAGYDLTSRYVIDYDHRAQFCATIVVRVSCTGARWDQASGSYLGALAKTTDPSYDVSITLEVAHGGGAVSYPLASGTCTRPGFEFIATFAPYNVFVYPADDALTPLIYYVPPQLGVPDEAVNNIKALADHQGVNPHFAGQDAMTDAYAPLLSKKGIDFSHLNGTQEVPHKGMPVGALYARSFRLSEFPDALWLLHALKCDAPVNNAYPDDGSEVMWYYMPALGTTINNTQFDIAWRDGVFTDWVISDMPQITDAPIDRSSVKIYRV